MIANHQQNSQIKELDKGVYQFQTAAFEFENGQRISPLVLVFETYGELNKKRDNAILIEHALSTSSHVASHAKNRDPGWWEPMVGSQKPIDSDKYFIICSNNLGSCYGSLGPASLNPKTKKPYRRDFPEFTIKDIVNAQNLLLQALRVKQLQAVVGNSMGGMMALEWAISYPEFVQRLISVSSAYKAYPVSVATHEIQRKIIAMDPDWKEGFYEINPYVGFKLAREFGLLSYRNPNELNARFSQKNNLLQYLEYNARKFVKHFDANSYLYIFNAMDKFDVTKNYPDPLTPFCNIKAQSLIISVTSDLLFPPQQQRELYEKLIAAKKIALLVEHDSNYGHDAFYADKTMAKHIREFLG